MLDKNDLKAIAEIVNNAIDKRVPKIVDEKIEKKVPKMIINALGEFFEQVLVPQFDRINEKLDEHSAKLENNDNNHDTTFRKLDAQENQQDRIIEKLDQIDEHLQNHEKRIKKVETVLNP